MKTDGAGARWLAAGAVLAAATLAAGCGDARRPGAGPAIADDGGEITDVALHGSTATGVTPVAGPSWIEHLGVSLDETAMGQMGGDGPAPPTGRREPDIADDAGVQGRARFHSMMGRFMRGYRSAPEASSAVLSETFALTGEDLYRLDCQSCHGPDGTGSPPEIKSLLQPVKGASPAFVKARMAKLGRTVSDDMAASIAGQAEAAIRKRLAQGGKKMPPFAHLRTDEVNALLGYLGTLAGVEPDERTDMLVTQSAARVGEHLVKGTCHICHAATGPGGGRMAMMRGIIPSLQSFPAQLSLSSVERQVAYGSAGMMMMMGGPRMPALPYLTEDEVAAAYFYLSAFPPRP